MQFIIQVGEQIHLPPVPPKFPRCGLHKGPNFIWYFGYIYICNIMVQNTVYLFFQSVHFIHHIIVIKIIKN